jgi:hypothetical protein
MTQLFRSERAKPNRLPDQGGDAYVPRHSEAPQDGANVQLLMDLAPLKDAWHGAQAQTAARGLSTAHWRWVPGHSTPIAVAAGAAV